MFFCSICEKGFRDRYNLDKHMSRIKPCGKNILRENLENNPNNTSLDQKDTSLDQKDTSINQKDIENKDNICNYCLHTFSTKSNKSI